MDECEAVEEVELQYLNPLHVDSSAATADGDAKPEGRPVAPTDIPAGPAPLWVWPMLALSVRFLSSEIWTDVISIFEMSVTSVQI